MSEKIDMSAVVSEIKNSNEDNLKGLIEQWFEKTRTQGMKLGAQYMAIGATSIMQRNLRASNKKPSLRSYERCIKELNKFFSVQLKTSDETEDTDTVGDTEHDGTTE